jgi:GNAT superfamily N-acetyltransferase
MQGVFIAPATIGDCSKCAQLLVEQLAEHSVDASAQRLEKVLEAVVSDKACGFLLVANANSQIVGVAYVATIRSAEHCGLVAWLEELYVTPGHRCCGIGTALMNAVLERARETGIVAVDLEIDVAHRRAASLYQRFGFRPLDRSRWVRDLEPG